MTILRSREIPSVSAKPLLKQSDIEPSTPARTLEPDVHRSPDELGLVDEPTHTTRRRSLRLAHQFDDDDSVTEKEVSGERREWNVDDKFLSLRSGKRVAKRGVDYGIEIESRKFDFDSELGGSRSKRKRVCVDLVEENIVKDELENSGDLVNGDVKLDSESSFMVKEEKGKAVMEDRSCSGVLGDLLAENFDVVGVENESKNKGKGIMEDSYGESDVLCVESYEKPSSSMGRRKYTREEKGKGIIQVEDVSSPITIEVDEEEMEVENSVNNEKPPVVSVPELVAAAVNVEQTQNQNSNEIGNGSRTQRYRDIAKRNASRFARFDAQIEEEEDLSDREGEQQVEDWPGPFSTAMNIIKDREENTTPYAGIGVSNKEKSSPTIWVPRSNYSFAPRRAPSLQELSLRILVKNADAITSLDYVPDTLRVKLCQLLCDSRRIDVHFLDLLVQGSPTEICVPDCSWLTEEQFTECFKNCDTSTLMVLQLDQCGRCMPDYVLHSTLARSPKQLPMLSSLSLSGACRLSDVGLRALVSSAPAITSINLSQCSLLTSSSIDMLSDSLGSVLRELYINECQNIDMKLIVSALKKFEKLEVLSLADLPSVKGQFLKEFVTARGQTLKQLILTNSGKLTDSSIKAISENCPNLSVLDLANVCKLTDSSLGYLANGCQALEKLIFCRNSFSDEAVAAFVETAGSSLKELSLNNVKKVGHNTALALAKHSDKLQILDVSWCREMSNDLLGYFVDNCSSLKVLKVFGCTQVTDVFVKGHSNPNVKILGLKMNPFLGHLTKNLADI
ncbi:Leucine-rich repeat cysteine-containing subtype [Arabidopsis thaliana x Arabidopsis arenosa]|uniref:Leucine-rich repeat cysteine-containing subtype n=1 Tax=Arabidopsis thaliana x Arabidopsis arenosa TaxID=1240361 RepID=A0A8T2AXM4_9BRAS|nr:Leucine-rich repeat cysteine-containing subtype [Arabidopsis thaliana x Arabidopsis arenosa]